jgi:hypothetical protein
MPHPALPSVPHLPIPILELVCDELAADVSRLGRILAAMRSATGLSRLAEIIGAAPSEVIPAAAPIKCKHGLRETWCASCANLNRSGKSKQRAGRSFCFQSMRTIEIGTRDGATMGTVSVLRVTRGAWTKSESVDLLADERRAKPKKRNNYGSALVPFVRAEPKSRKEILTGPPNDVEERHYEYKQRVEPTFADALSLAEYAARHQDDEAATLPHLPNGCDGCQRYVTVLHDAGRCAAKILAEHLAVAKMQAAKREAWRQRRHAALIAQGLYSPETFDQEIIRARSGTVEAEVITKFDRDLSRKGNKYRIQ